MRSSRRDSPPACGWKVIAAQGIPRTLISEYVRPALGSIPPEMARELGICRISLVQDLGAESVVSKWTSTDRGLEISVAASGREAHDVTLELLLCLGQALWTRLSHAHRKAYWLLLDDEIGGGVSGEIDEDALQQKERLMSNRTSAGSSRRLENYGCAYFAGTVAEYVHSLWHDVTIRSGPDFLPAKQLRRRLEMLSRWYPPGLEYRLFPKKSDGPSESQAPDRHDADLRRD